MQGFVTRFAPSPTGLLHLGHAFSALVTWDKARAASGPFLLRIEDIDIQRCKPEFEAAIYEDLRWLGLDWPEPVLRQSARLSAYDAALDRLTEMGLTYPCSCTRADIRAALSAPQEGAEPALGPDGLVYPGTCRDRRMERRTPDDAIRLDMRKALRQLSGTGMQFTETGPAQDGRHHLNPDQLIAGAGDIVLARKDIGTSYHLSVVVDDAAQEITHVVRGEDLFPATPIHVLLQALLGYPAPIYHHHRLIRDDTGKRLAKRDDARAIRTYRQAGATPSDIRRMVGL